MLIMPSEPLTPGLLTTDLPSPLPFRRLGVPVSEWLKLGVLGVFDFLEGLPPAESGLGGRLVTRTSPRGGWGKELMLTVFLTALPVDAAVETALGWGSADVGAGVAGGRNVVDGARRPLLGVVGDLFGPVGMPPVLFLVFATGRAGRATVGGPTEGRDGRGSAVDIVSVNAFDRSSSSAL